MFLILKQKLKTTTFQRSTNVIIKSYLIVGKFAYNYSTQTIKGELFWGTHFQHGGKFVPQKQSHNVLCQPDSTQSPATSKWLI